LQCRKIPQDILTKTEMCRQRSVELSNIKGHENTLANLELLHADRPTDGHYEAIRSHSATSR
jgi:hypothetical protein